MQIFNRNRQETNNSKESRYKRTSTAAAAAAADGSPESPSAAPDGEGDAWPRWVEGEEESTGTYARRKGSTVRLDGTQETQENTRGFTSSATRSGGEACWGEPAPWSAEGEEEELYARRKILECKNRKESQEKKQEMQENEVSGWGFTWSEGELPGDAGCAGIACLGRVP